MNIHNPGVKMPTYHSPCINPDTLNLPRDRATINAWARTFYALDPDVHRIINQHALMIGCSYDLVECKSPAANQLIQKQMDRLCVPALIDLVVREFFVIGESFMYAEMSEQDGMWSSIIIQNPDYIVVKRKVGETKYFLRPDENIRHICFSNRPEDIAVRNLLADSIVEAVRKGENIALDPFNLYYMTHKISPYEIRGTSFITPLLRIMGQEHMPTMDPEERRAIKQVLFDITAYDKAGIAKTMLLQQYSLLIDALEFWFNSKLIAPVAKINDLHAYRNGEKVLMHPQVKFNRAKLKKEINKVK